MSGLSPQEIERYARHLVLPEIGGAGQQRLKAARVLVIGAGGLGAPVLMYLASAGVGTLRVADDDHVSLSNLQRQVIHDTDRLGDPKVESAVAALRRINPNVIVQPVAERFTKESASRLLEGVTLAVDGSDNFKTRYAVADACALAKVPLVTGAVNRFDGSVTVLMPWEGDNPSYRDLFPDQPDDSLLPACSETGIMGAVTGIIGAILAAEAIKVITGAGEPLIGRLLMVDTLTMAFQTVRYRRRG